MKKGEKKDNTLDIISISLGLTVIIGLLLFIIISFSLYEDDNYPKTWNVYFSRIINASCSEGAVCTSPIIYTNSTTIGDYTFEMNSKDNKARYELTVVNEGLIDAELTSIILSTPKCKSNSSDPEIRSIDEGICNGLQYRLVDEDNNTITLGDRLKANESKKLYLTIEYNNMLDFGTLNESVTVSNLSMSLNYGQV